ncbi:MAG: ATP-binding cassette domain-containing protein, partial [Candidatus Cloacimonadota bacterium]|nr:ATP-binding cassette domain-containing protein [Candidatus Cloacimonadota bacterium]
MIKIENLNLGFADKLVLKDINLEIPENQITSIVGQSGCGKSVLMKTIEGLFQPASGKIYIDNKEITNLHKKELNKIRQRMSMLFQESALLDSLNVFQNVALPIYENHNKTEEEIYSLVKQNLKLVGLESVLTKMPSQLSGGMKKRVALARAIIRQPRYIIYDEPTTGLDPIISDEITRLILKLQNSYQLTSIIISHDMQCIS